MKRRSRTIQITRGFTIVELLIVIVVIGILAAIVIVAYNGIQTRAIETSMQSDLRSAATKISIDYVDNGAYPADAASVDGGSGLHSSNGTVLTYVTKPYGYCVTASNTKTSKTYAVGSSTGTIAEGNCDVTVTTFAGSGVAGFADGTGQSAQFSDWAGGIAVDASGNVYVADSDNFRIRKITPAGVVTTFAGSGTEGYANGTGTAAQFGYVEGIVVDTSGTLYAADRSNNRIRKVTPAGVVTTFAGSGVAGYANGTGTAAQFRDPLGITVDASGNLYVSDTHNYRIRKITPAGVVTTFAGSGTEGYANGTGTAAQFGYVEDLTVDDIGNLYLADSSNYRIRKITPAGVVTSIAGSGAEGFADGTGVAAQFSYIEDIAIDDAHNIYLADTDNYRIRKLTQAGVVTTYAGTGVEGYANGAGTVARFGYVGGIAMDHSGNLYFADTNARVRKIEP